MHKNHDLNIEQTRLNHAYQQLNSNQDLYSYHNNIEDDQPLYWAFLKLRIGFSILFLFFLIACFKTAPVKESKKVQSAFSHISQTDPYTKHVLQQFDLNLSSDLNLKQSKNANKETPAPDHTGLAFLISLSKDFFQFNFLTIIADKTIFHILSSY